MKNTFKISRIIKKEKRLIWMRKKTSYRYTLNPVWISNPKEYHLHKKRVFSNETFKRL
jgi:hypothetical protein